MSFGAGTGVTFMPGAKDMLSIPTDGDGGDATGQALMPVASSGRRESQIYTSQDSIVVTSKLNKIFAAILVILSYIFIVLSFPLSMLWCLKVVKEYERAVMFRLGRLVRGGCQGPGLIFIIPCVDTYRKVDLRVVSFEVPPQEILSKDSVTVSVDAVVYFRINNPVVSVTNVNDAFYSTKLLAQTTLRNILGTKTLGDMLLERDHISQVMEMVLYEATLDWGVKVERVEVKDLRLPGQLMRAMAAEAEASREARAKVVAAEGEHRASRALKKAADIITQSPLALQLRYLQTLNHIAAEQSSTIMFPVPMSLVDMVGPEIKPPPRKAKAKGKAPAQGPGTLLEFDADTASTMATRPTQLGGPLDQSIFEDSGSRRSTIVSMD